jgi:hypothetical protein
VSSIDNLTLFIGCPLEAHGETLARDSQYALETAAHGRFFGFGTTVVNGRYRSLFDTTCEFVIHDSRRSTLPSSYRPAFCPQP